MILNLILPTGPATMDVDDTLLVFDGNTFVPVAAAQWVELYDGSTASDYEPRDLIMRITTFVAIRARVVGRELVPTTDTDPLLMVHVDPSDGECICGITCEGTNLTYVKVQPEN